VRDFPPLLTAAEMRAADAAAISGLGLPSLILMENAGRGLAGIIRREVDAGDGARRDGDVAIVCGAGNNGGDGLVAARHLARAGVPVHVVLTAPPDAARGDAALNLTALQRMGGVAIADGSGWTTEAPWRNWFAGAAIVVDAIFGTGFRGALEGVPAAAVAAMNAASARKIAVDVPSGLNADTGRADGVVFRADVTATMGACKLGLFVDADAPVGRVEVVELGVPILVDGRGAGAGGAGVRTHLLDEPGIAAMLPRRRASAHKGSAGHLLVVAGSPGKTGAAVLVGQSALRSGAGLVTIASTAPGQAALDAKVVELMTARYAKGAEVDGDEAVAALTKLAEHSQAIAIGPGIPTGDGMHAVVRRLAAAATRPMVLDADALNALGTDAPTVLAAAPAPRVLTPHPAEMGRLTGLSTADVQADRLGVARRLAAATRAIVVLKGARTVIATPDGRAFVSPIACAALATAGSGDVLCGVIGALLASGADPLEAAQIAVFVHGLAGEALSVDLGDGVAAGDLPIAIASVIARLQHRGEDRRAVTPPAGGRRKRAAERAPKPARKGGRRPRRPSPPKPRRRSRS
jgi:ADP-dependent NAD(P)H-hydrate dehydratase / NAD(P)H-hydrate epimerase